MQISLINSSETNTTCLEHILGCSIIDTHFGEDNIGSCFDDFVDSWFQDIALFLPDFFQVLGIIHQNLDTKLQSEFVEIEIQACNFGFFYLSGHQLVSLYCLNRIPIYQLALSTALPVRFQDVDVFYVVFWAEDRFLLNTTDWVYHQVCEKARIYIDKLARHRSLCAVKQSLLTKTVNRLSKFILNVSARFLSCNLESSNDICGMNFHFYEFVGSLQQLSSKNNNWSCAIADFRVLELRQLH